MALILECEYSVKHSANTCTIQIHDRLGGTGVTEFCTRPTGAIISYEGKTRDLYQSIVPLSCTFGMLIENAAHEAFLESLAIEEENRYYVAVYTPALSFIGNLIIDEVIIEDTNKGSYWFDITATDGMADLQNIPYVDAAGDPYEGRKTISEHLENIFSKLVTADLLTGAFVQLPWFSDEFIDESKCAFEVSYVDHEVFQERTDEAIKPFNCYKVLELIMEGFDCSISTRGPELRITNWNTYGSPTTIPTFVFLDLTFTGGSKFFHDKLIEPICQTGVGNAVALAGGNKVLQAPARTTTVTYLHGAGSNWLFGKKFLNLTDTEFCVNAGDIPTVTEGMRFHFTGTLRYFVSKDRDPINHGCRILTSIKIRIGGQYYINNTVPTSIGILSVTPPQWDSSPGYFGVAQTGYVERYNDDIPPEEFNGSDNFDILSSEIPLALSGEDLEICVFFKMYDREGNELPLADYPAFVNVENPVFNFVEEDNVIIEKTSTSISILNSINNSKQYDRTMVFGDGPNAASASRITILDGGSQADTATWYDALQSSGSFPLHELVARSMIARRMKTVRVKEGEFQGVLLPFAMLDYDGHKYAPIQVDWLTRPNVMRGEWASIVIGNAWGLDSTNVVEEGKRPTGGVTGGGVVVSGAGGDGGATPYRKIYTGAMTSITIPFTLNISEATEDQQAAVVWVFRNGVKMILGDSGINGFEIVESGSDLLITPTLPFQANDLVETIYFI